MCIRDREKDESLPEHHIRDMKKTLLLLASNKLGMYSPEAVSHLTQYAQAAIDAQSGGIHDAAPLYTEYVQTGGPGAPAVSDMLAGTEASEHDLAAARAIMAESVTNYRTDYQAGYSALRNIMARMQIDSEAQDWAGVLSDADAIAPMVQKYSCLLYTSRCV